MWLILITRRFDPYPTLILHRFLPHCTVSRLSRYLVKNLFHLLTGRCTGMFSCLKICHFVHDEVIACSYQKRRRKKRGGKGGDLGTPWCISQGNKRVKHGIGLCSHFLFWLRSHCSRFLVQFSVNSSCMDGRCHSRQKIKLCTVNLWTLLLLYTSLPVHSSRPGMWLGHRRFKVFREHL